MGWSMKETALGTPWNYKRPSLSNLDESLTKAARGGLLRVDSCLVRVKVDQVRRLPSHHTCLSQGLNCFAPWGHYCAHRQGDCMQGWIQTDRSQFSFPVIHLFAICGSLAHSFILTLSVHSFIHCFLCLSPFSSPLSFLFDSFLSSISTSPFLPLLLKQFILPQFISSWFSWIYSFVFFPKSAMKTQKTRQNM